MRRTYLALAVFTLVAWSSQARGQEPAPEGESKWGDEWPALKECLEFSAESGDWASGGVLYRFQPDGTFSIRYRTPFRNRLQRLKQRVFVFQGNWKLARRTFSPSEKARLQIPANNRFRGYFLELTFTENKVEPPFEAGTKYSEMFSSPSGGSLKQRGVFLLDEQNEYPLERNSQAKGKSDPRTLHWIVLLDELGFFPEDTEPGKAAWTIGHI